MDKEIIFFIIFVVFSILSSLLNRKKKKTGQPPFAGEDSPYQPAPKKKPFSFEDILREFEAEVEKQRPSPQKEVVMEEEEEDDYEYQRESSYTQPVEEVQRGNSIYESYEGTSYETLDNELEKVAEKNERLSKAMEEKEKVVAGDYANTLQDPEGIRKAFIMKEILDRKYF